jgi:hypothetical protein
MIKHSATQPQLSLNRHCHGALALGASFAFTVAVFAAGGTQAQPSLFDRLGLRGITAVTDDCR